ncbi:beta-propeller domain-containing protein [Janthinobacterium fluminis]|uniref:Beta-propeller domain-containing protein n=1 Tax=Janthinobacterium fluminis TaxID=2987524 RepID=A0ABT5K657_9BURK|nr:beta-propeller domain-containing protein [Janthinobacterium fluminis]MDC8759566.1 beta-propeller domain-containing protein [Janthinobacterium fluminis]
MTTSIAAGIALALAAALSGHAAAADPAPKKTLSAFASDAAVRDFIKRYGDAQRAIQQRHRASKMEEAAGAPMPMYAPSVAANMAPSPQGALAAPAGPAADSVTNTQTAGVDEGGIVKVHGKHLVMLRRGRLFTVNVGQGQLKPVAALDAFAPGTDPAASWYDEMLISGDTVAVIGYNYQRGGTEIGLFDIDAAGALNYRATYHMRSNDYYSSRNYASRQIGSKLVFYTPLRINPWQHDPLDAFPALRRWQPQATPADFKRIAPATRIYRTDEPVETTGGLALHTVTVCDLAQRDMTCQASAVLGPRGRVFYVSGESVYVWTTPVTRAYGPEPRPSGLFRIPLDGSAPSALKVAGAPVDQFSFLESGDGHLNVLVRAGGSGDGMWSAERGGGDLALLRVPLGLFSDGRDSAPAANYKALPSPGGYNQQNRFVGAYLLYGSATPQRPDAAWPRQPLYAVRWGDASGAQTLALPHAVERIEAMGGNAVVIGAAGKDLHFSSVSLDREAAVAYRYIRADAAQGESRSHGFFYKPMRADEGVIGLPVLQAGVDGPQRGRAPAASVLYLQNSALKLDELGSLQAQPGAQADDGCRASCVDWYGNARPLFLAGRVFALMGYELVEGKVQGGRMQEVRRVSYAPPPRVPR